MDIAAPAKSGLQALLADDIPITPEETHPVFSADCAACGGP